MVPHNNGLHTLIPFIAFSPGIGLSFGQGWAEYTGFSSVMRTGPTAPASFGGERKGAVKIAKVATVARDRKLRRSFSEYEGISRPQSFFKSVSA